MMSQKEEPPAAPPSSLPKISLDWWAVITALALVALILVGVIQSIPW